MEYKDFRVPQSHANSTSDSPTLLFVQGLPLHACDTNLAKYFRQFGPLDFVEVHRFQNGKSKGTGYIQFVSPSDSRKVLQAEQAHQVMGKQVAVQLVAVPESLNFETKLRTNRKLFIGNIPPNTSKETIYNLLSRIAPVERVTHLRTSVGNFCYCYAIMYNYADRQKLVSKGKLLLEDGSVIQVKKYIPVVGSTPEKSPPLPVNSIQQIPESPNSYVTAKDATAWPNKTPMSIELSEQGPKTLGFLPTRVEIQTARLRSGLELTKSVILPHHQGISHHHNERSQAGLHFNKATTTHPSVSRQEPQQSFDHNYRFNVRLANGQLTMLKPNWSQKPLTIVRTSN